MTRWAQARAGLVALAIAFGLVEGCPLPRTGALRAAQRVAESPVAWLRGVVRVTQRWSLYSAPESTRYRMWIEGQRADHAWDVLYRAGDPDHREDAALIEHARVWGTWSPRDPLPPEYQAFAGWILARMLAAHPDLVATRLKMERIAIVPGGFEPSGTFAWTNVRLR